MIKIKNYDKTNHKISFITDMSINLANAIRRGVLEIPIMAIDEAEISKNDSALYDEIIAHRLGLIPIKTSKTIKATKFKLKETGPKTVYATDLKPGVGTNYKLPIVILDEGQEIAIVGNAKLGKGIEHVKYSPGLIYYKHNIDEDILDFVDVDENNKINYNEDELKKQGASEELINKIKKLHKIEEILFNIESWGQLDVKNIFINSIEVLDKNLQELNKAIK